LMRGSCSTVWRAVEDGTRFLSSGFLSSAKSGPPLSASSCTQQCDTLSSSGAALSITLPLQGTRQLVPLGCQLSCLRHESQQGFLSSTAPSPSRHAPLPLALQDERERERERERESKSARERERPPASGPACAQKCARCGRECRPLCDSKGS